MGKSQSREEPAREVCVQAVAMCAGCSAGSSIVLDFRTSLYSEAHVSWDSGLRRL